MCTTLAVEPPAPWGTLTVQVVVKVAPLASLAVVAGVSAVALQPLGRVSLLVTSVISLGSLFTRELVMWKVEPSMAVSLVSIEAAAHAGISVVAPRSSTRKLSSVKSLPSWPPWVLYRPTQ